MTLTNIYLRFKNVYLSFMLSVFSRIIFGSLPKTHSEV